MIISKAKDKFVSNLMKDLSFFQSGGAEWLVGGCRSGVIHWKE